MEPHDRRSSHRQGITTWSGDGGQGGALHHAIYDRRGASIRVEQEPNFNCSFTPWKLADFGPGNAFPANSEMGPGQYGLEE